MRDTQLSAERGAAFLDARYANSSVTEAVNSALREWPMSAPSDRRQVPAHFESGVVVRLVNGAEFEPGIIRWLWDGWLSRGKLHVMAGAPGTGKTTIALALAAAVSTGGRFPDGSKCEASSVLVWSGEDDPKDTLLPRLLAMGADRSRIFFVTDAYVAGAQEFLIDLLACAQQVEEWRDYLSVE